MTQVMHSVAEVSQMITSGQTLILAGDEKALRQLPKGNWIAGTIPYFMGDNGGEFSQEKIYVTVLPEYASNPVIKIYDENTIKSVYVDAPEHGFSMIIITAASKTHQFFSLNAPAFKNFATRPLIGWISGVYLQDLGKVTPKVYNGKNGKVYENAAVVLNVTLPKNKGANIEIVNMFEQGTGDTLTFDADGFSFKDINVNGQKMALADYIKQKNIDIKLPLVANYYGALINSSFQAVNEQTGQVDFYAPLFKGVEYKLAKPVPDYVKSFEQVMSRSMGKKILFACNCILNYLYSGLEGKKTGNVTGPVTFGEVAYQLLNQTLAYMTIEDI